MIKPMIDHTMSVIRMASPKMSMLGLKVRDTDLPHLFDLPPVVAPLISIEPHRQIVVEIEGEQGTAREQYLNVLLGPRLILVRTITGIVKERLDLHVESVLDDVHQLGVALDTHVQFSLDEQVEEQTDHVATAERSRDESELHTTPNTGNAGNVDANCVA